jgi:hypothetical protein
MHCELILRSCITRKYVQQKNNLLHSLRRGTAIKIHASQSRIVGTSRGTHRSEVVDISNNRHMRSASAEHGQSVPESLIVPDETRLAPEQTNEIRNRGLVLKV